MVLTVDDSPVLEHYEDKYSAQIVRYETFARFFDSQYEIPGTKIRFGWDALIGLIPGFGDILTLIPQGYFLIEAIRLKVSKETFLRMLMNIVIDWAGGTIPLIGDIFDVAFKSNNLNARLLTEELRKRQAIDV